LKGNGGTNKKTSLANTKELKENANHEKDDDGITKIERSRTQDQKTKTQTNKKPSRRRESNPTHDLKF
jgi:hypothetical protein